MKVFGCPVHINPNMSSQIRHTTINLNQETGIESTYSLINLNLPLFIDIETDTKDNLVGIGYTQDGINLYYCTVLTDELRQILSQIDLIGHNLKGDAHWLKDWGVDIKSYRLVADTMLMSYAIYGSSKSHALKSLAKEELDMEWATYKEMTTISEKVIKLKKTYSWIDENDGKKHRKKLNTPEEQVSHKTKRITLDQVPVEKVAEYCCKDVLATYRLYSYLKSKMSEKELHIYDKIELPCMQVIFDMENRGIKLNVDKLSTLDIKVSVRLAEIVDECKLHAGDINIGSSKQLAPVLEKMGFWLPTTKKGNKSTKKAVLELHKGHPFIDLLLEYSEFKKLYTSFTKPLSELKTLPRVYPTFNQVRTEDGEEYGISTGRLSCKNPNLQQIPVRSELAKEVRSLFIPDEGKVLIDADFSQIEPRITAHISGDIFLHNIFNTGKDLYLELIKDTVWEHEIKGRSMSKLFELALNYGAQAKKLATVFKCDIGEAQRRLDQRWAKTPQVKEWQMKTIADAKRDGYVSTLYGRKRYLPDINSDDFFVRASAERKAINTPIQGTAADIMKMAMIDLHKYGYPIQSVVHDEVILSVDPEDVEQAMDDIKTIMETVVKLDVPIKVEIKSGTDWNNAKG